jgi:hypothetical protein
VLQAPMVIASNVTFNGSLDPQANNVYGTFSIVPTSNLTAMQTLSAAATVYT